MIDGIAFGALKTESVGNLAQGSVLSTSAANWTFIAWDRHGDAGERSAKLLSGWFRTTLQVPGGLHMEIPGLYPGRYLNRRCRTGHPRKRDAIAS